MNPCNQCMCSPAQGVSPTYVSTESAVGESCSNGAAQLRSLECLLLEASFVVRSHMNFIAPINRLPAEVLSVIFSMASLVSFGPAIPRYPVGWCQSSQVLHTQIMRVCHLWRGVARSATSLRSDIVLRPQKGPSLSAQLTRVRTTAINVYSEGRVKSLVSALSQHAYRIRNLHVRAIGSFETTAKLNSVLELLPRTAPRIEELVLHAGYTWPSPLPKISTASIFSGPAPRLRLLSLDPMTFPPTDPFPNLRELYITIASSTKPVDLLVMLRGSPRLEHVYLSAIIEHPLEAPHGDFARLPRIRTIVLSIGANTAYLLHRLFLPLDCLIRLEGLGLQEVTPCLEALERQLEAKQLTRLLLSKEKNIRPLFVFDSLYITLCNAAANMGLQLGIVGIGGGAYQRQAFTEVFVSAFRSCPLYANVEELSVSAARGLVDHTLLNSLRSLTTINHIFGDGCRRRSTTRRDAQRAPNLAQAGPDGAVVCPSLHSLYFVGRVRHAKLEDARKILRFRQEAGHPLARFGIDCSSVFQEEADALREFVDDLDVEYRDKSGYERRAGAVTVPSGGWRSHPARARFQWPRWPEF